MLDSEADVGMNGPLIDNEGYPRNDIDVVKVRTARQKIICLMNDHKQIMKKISDALECIHQQNSNGTGNYQLSKIMLRAQIRRQMRLGTYL